MSCLCNVFENTHVSQTLSINTHSIISATMTTMKIRRKSSKTKTLLIFTHWHISHFLHENSEFPKKKNPRTSTKPNNSEKVDDDEDRPARRRGNQFEGVTRRRRTNWRLWRRHGRWRPRPMDYLSNVSFCHSIDMSGALARSFSKVDRERSSTYNFHDNSLYINVRPFTWKSVSKKSSIAWSNSMF